MSRYLDMEAIDSLVGESSDEEALYHSPRSQRKRSAINLLASDTDSEDEYCKSPVRRRKKGSGSSAIRKKFRANMNAIERENPRASANSGPGTSGGGSSDPGTSGNASSDPGKSGNGSSDLGMSGNGSDPGTGRNEANLLDGGEIVGEAPVQDHEDGDQIALLMEEVKTGNRMLVQLTNRVKKTEIEGG